MYSGLNRDISNEAYHSGEGLSKSDLDMIHISPLHYKTRKEQIEPPTDAMILGTAFHMAVLEPERFKRKYAQAPDIDRRTKAGKEAWAEIEAQGLTVLAAKEFERIAGMSESVMQNPIARDLIEGSIHESSAYAKINDVLCKCRPDIWHEGRGIIADLNTTMDASPKSFSKSCANFRYHVQDAWYRMVVEEATGEVPNEFVFIAVEKNPPYAVALYCLDFLAKEQGFREAMDDMSVYKKCMETGDWYGYDKAIQPLSLPRWAQD